ncbi:Gfo/Idh/MocA family protein [Sharpea azabuensis]|uniref:Gfo/Idh/MocA family protein n=1 Tax=Sharpea azabuensis TaxID=322505 RepID=UPI0013DCE8B5|nr:Gfo/Idh/MocA family oxidoreductase [Sharpea azabuensis]
MKLGILGTGKIVEEMLPMLVEQDVEKVYLFSTKRSEEKASMLVELYHLDGHFVDFKELLESDVDTIYIALPNSLHYAYAKEALLANKHVICEKPMTSTIEEARELACLAREKKRILTEAVTLYAMPAVMSLKEHLNEIGQIKIVSLNYSQYSSRYDRFKEGIITPAFDPSKSGGALYDINVYNVHFAINLFGKPKDVDYYANIERNIDTSGILFMDYGQFKLSAIGAKDTAAPLVNTIEGDKGYITIHSPVSRMTQYTLHLHSGEEYLYDFDEKKHAMSYEFKRMITMIKEKNDQLAEEMMENSLAASEVLTTARRKAGIVFDADKD